MYVLERAERLVEFTRSRTSLVVLFGATWFGSVAFAESAAEPLVTVERGELPIVLSAPHGGSRSIPGVPLRRGVGVESFKSKSDAYTGSLTERLADALEKELGKRPYVVIARFHRKYIDANRPRAAAYESEAAKPVYDAYHRALETARGEVVERWGRGLLLDVHGQAAEPKAVIRGTRNGSTTKHLVLRFGREALIGETSLFGRLAKQGFPVIPEVGSSDDEHPAYDGGHIVATYGSRQSGTLDAIQLELGRELRSPRNNDDTAKRLANAITAFANDYLPKDERRRRPLPVELPGTRESAR